MNSVKRFEELSDAFVNVRNDRYFRIYYKTKFIQLDNSQIMYNVDNTMIKSYNYIRIGQHRRVNGLTFGGVNHVYTIERIRIINTLDYRNLISTFVQFPKFLDKVINILEKELLNNG